MSKEGSYYIIIPGKVRSDSRLSCQAKLLYGEIMVKTNMEGFCWASNKYLAASFGVNIRSIQRSLRELEDLKYIICELVKDDEGTERKIYLCEAMDKMGVNNVIPPNDKNVTTPHDKSCTPPHTNLVTPPHDTGVIHTNKRKKINKSIDNSSLLSNDNKEGRPSDFLDFEEVEENKTTLFPLDEPEKNRTKGGAAKKSNAAKEKVNDGHNEFIKVYEDWYEHRCGIPAGVLPQDRKNIKTIIAQSRAIATKTAKDKNVILDDNSLRIESIKVWDYVLKNWDKIDPFLQNKMSITEIAKQYSNIVNQIKNGRVQQNTKKPTGGDVNPQGLASKIAAFDHFNQQAGNGHAG